jgi:hypothetical protein
MNTNQIMDACKRVDDDDDDAFSWEDAIAELGLSKEDGLIVLAVLSTAHLNGKVDDFFAMGLC